MRSMTAGRTLAAYSTSSAVESRPSEKRTKELASSFGTPIANRTCDGVRDPAEQAEPLEAQIPAMSRPASKAILSQPATVKETVLDK